MTTWYSYVRAFHILCGMMALFVAPVALVARKGGADHKVWGRIYFWSMAAVAASAMTMAVYKPILFLALVAVFSFYFAFRGYRAVVTKNRGAGPADWIAAVAVAAGGAGLIGLGLHPVAGAGLPAPAVSLVFGTGGVGIRRVRYAEVLAAFV